MIFEEELDYYQILGLSPHATQQEILQSYLKMKKTYSKKNHATYSLLEQEESHQILKQIEEAYKILSHELARKQYDENHIQPDTFPAILDTPSVQKKTLVPFFSPSTSAPPPPHPSAPPPSSISSFDKNKWNFLKKELLEKLFSSSQWPGEILRQAREAHDLSITELSKKTKISKRYLQAIEEEQFDVLPASAYVRGFVIQIARELDLPKKKVAQTYLERYKKHFLNKKNNKKIA